MKTLKNKLFKKICAVIPHWVSNQTFLAAYHLLGRLQRILKKDFSGQMQKNEEAFLTHLDTIRNNKGFIEDQNSYADMSYGKVTMKYAGCEIFATYNAVRSILGTCEIPLPRMISVYEKDGMVFSGRFGTSPKAIQNFLDQQGFRTELITQESKFDELAGHSDSLILTMYNDRDDISKEVHTVNISKEDGQYLAHNVYCNGKVVGPCRTVCELMAQMNNGRVKGISLIGVSR